MDILGSCEYCGQSNTDTSGKCYNPQCPSKQITYSDNTGMTLDDKARKEVIIICRENGNTKIKLKNIKQRKEAVWLLELAKYKIMEDRTEIEKLKSQIYELQRQLELERNKNIKGA